MSQVTERNLPCPNCPSSDAYCIYDDGHGYCFSCNEYVSDKKKEEEYTYEYLPWRGVSKETFRFYGCETKINAEGTPISTGYRYPNGSYKIRRRDTKEFYSVGEINKAGLFGRNLWDQGSHKQVVITEGELDALSMYQVVKIPVVSVQSSSSAVRDCSVDHDWLRSFDRIYLAFDGDEHGREAMERVAKLLDYDRTYVLKFERRKDANEYLQAGEADELLNIWSNAKKYKPESIVSTLSEFREILEKPIQLGIPYPFRTLTEMTYGIRKGESVLITAQEGVGKTELMHAIEHQLLKETKENVGAIFLEELPQRHLQALAGIELKAPVHLPDSGRSQNSILDAIQTLVGSDDRLHLYSHFGSTDPELLLDAQRFLVCARRCGFVLLDHISMVVSGIGERDERRQLDNFATKQTTMVKELGYALIMVSHVNDEGMTRGSRYISKVADIRIDAFRDLQSEDPLERNTIYLTVSKNRFSGKTGPAGRLLFDMGTYSYEELEGSYVTEAANDNSWRTQRMAS